jgi:hypothetical protein
MNFLGTGCGGTVYQGAAFLLFQEEKATVKRM